jgi:hypothetical protein
MPRTSSSHEILSYLLENGAPDPIQNLGRLCLSDQADDPLGVRAPDLEPTAFDLHLDSIPQIHGMILILSSDEVENAADLIGRALQLFLDHLIGREF